MNQIKIRSVPSSKPVNIANVGSLKVKYSPCLMLVAPNLSEAVNFEN